MLPMLGSRGRARHSAQPREAAPMRSSRTDPQTRRSSKRMRRAASSIISRTISAAGLIALVNPALSPAARHISSKSPTVSGVGRMAANFGIRRPSPAGRTPPLNGQPPLDCQSVATKSMRRKILHAPRQISPFVLLYVGRIGNTDDLRQRSPPRGPRPRDIRCQTRTRNAAGADATAPRSRTDVSYAHEDAPLVSLDSAPAALSRKNQEVPPWSSVARTYSG